MHLMEENHMGVCVYIKTTLSDLHIFNNPLLYAKRVQILKKDIQLILKSTKRERKKD